MMKRKGMSAIAQSLEHRILHGLLCEWKAVLEILSPVHRKNMKPPLFSIRDLTSKYGYWSSDRGEICLSRNLVMNHSWDAVRDVLLHEMAHQLADQVLGAREETPHGPAFSKACHLLRANPRASGNYPLIDEPARDGEGENSTHIQLRRIKKLMALAESQNQHEAESAMLKAHELVKKYNIDLIAGNENRVFISVFLGKPALRHTRDHYHLARILTQFYFVEGLWVSSFSLDKGKMGRVLEITGTPSNIQMASYVYHFVRRFISSQWNEYNKSRGLGHQPEIDFSVGILEGFRSKLSAVPQKPDIPFQKTIGQLVTLEDPLLKAHMAYRYPHTRSFSRSAVLKNEAVLNDGIRIGKKLVISKGICHTEKSGRFLIHNRK